MNIEQYIGLLIDQLNEESDYSVFGLSFGGMLAQEMLLRINPDILFLASTIISKSEIPWYYRLILKTRFYRLFKYTLKNNPNSKLILMLSGFHKGRAKFIRKMLKRIDPSLIEFSLDTIRIWNPHNDSKPKFRIAGGRDRFLKDWQLNPDLFIENGDHLITISHPKQISKFIEGVLKKRGLI
jgi:pimeloyl-ACP methyl ester carboxylesterase